MPYETGVATGEDDLLDKIRIFLVANGWTQNGWAADGDGYRLHLQKGTQYVNFRSTNTNPSFTENTNSHIWLAGSEGYNGALAWDAQPNSSPKSLLRDIGGTYVAYHIFLNGDCCYVVVEQTSGIFRHMAFGRITKVGLAPAQSGCFVGAIYWVPGSTAGDNTYHSVLFDSTYNTGRYTSYIRLDVDSYTGTWIPFSYSQTPAVIGPCRIYGLCSDLFLCQPNTFNALAILQPLMCLAKRPSGLYSPIGYPPDITEIHLGNYSPADEFTLGADTWKVFPWYQRASTLTGYKGYAYRKVA